MALVIKREVGLELNSDNVGTTYNRFLLGSQILLEGNSKKDPMRRFALEMKM